MHSPRFRYRPRRAVWRIITVAAWAGLLACSGVRIPASGKEHPPYMEVLVAPAEHLRLSTPVWLEIAGHLPEVGYRSLRDPADGTLIPLQLVERDRGRFLVFVMPRQEAGVARRFILTKEPAPGKGVDLVREEAKIDVSIGGAPLTSFHFAPDRKKPYLYPVLGPDGVRLTRGFPMEDIPGEAQDHPHHRSLYTAHGDVNGADCWSEGKNSGSQRTEKILAAEPGSVIGRLASRQTWRINDGTPLLTEEREYVFYNTGPADRLIDLRVAFIATEGEARFGDTKEGGIASVRVNHQIAGTGSGTLRNSRGGIGEAECWGERAEWCDYSGPIDGATYGIAIFDHPDNLRHPTWWHARDYGLMTANCFGISYFDHKSGERGDYTLAPEASLVFRYRIVLHRRDPASAGLAGRYRDYAEPPRAGLAHAER